jgi:hypothetical protein
MIATDLFILARAFNVRTWSAGLAIDQARAPRQGGDGGRSQGKPSGENVAVASNEPDNGRVAPGHNPKPVMLDLVKPVGSRGRNFSRRRQTRLKDAVQDPLQSRTGLATAGRFSLPAGPAAQINEFIPCQVRFRA